MYVDAFLSFTGVSARTSLPSAEQRWQAARPVAHIPIQFFRSLAAWERSLRCKGKSVENLPFPHYGVLSRGRIVYCQRVESGNFTLGLELPGQVQRSWMLRRTRADARLGGPREISILRISIVLRFDQFPRVILRRSSKKAQMA